MPLPLCDLPAPAVRELLGLSRELRALRDPAAWRSHLVAALGRLIPGSAAIAAEIATDLARTTPLHVVHRGLRAVPEPAAADVLAHDVLDALHRAIHPLGALVLRRGAAFAALRADLVDDDRWRGSSLAHHLAGHRLADFVVASAPAPHAGVSSVVVVLRASDEPAPTRRDRELLALLHDDLATDWSAPVARPPHLSPRQRAVLGCLTAGATEKQIAAQLAMSRHTTHDHIKAVYRAFGVHRRSQLLGLVAAADRIPRAALVAEQPAAQNLLRRRRAA